MKREEVERKLKDGWKLQRIRATVKVAYGRRHGYWIYSGPEMKAIDGRTGDYLVAFGKVRSLPFYHFLFEYFEWNPDQ